MSPGARPEADGRDRRDVGAAFSGAMAGRPGRPPLYLVVLVVAVGGLVVAGLGGQDAGGTAASPAPSSGPAAVATPEVPPPTPLVVTVSPDASPGQAPVVTSASGRPLALTIRRHPESMFVHGDVHPVGVTWVFVNLVSAEGRVAAWTQVSIPGGTGAPPEGRPAMRFDVELAMPPWATGPLWVQGTAYDGSGSVVAQEQLGVWPDGSSMDAPAETGMSDGLAPDSIQVVTPAGEEAIRTATITVSGELRIKASSIRVELLTSDRRLLASRSVRTEDVDGGIRPVRPTPFEVRLGIPDPRPTDARVWVVITALDGEGGVVAFQRREVTIIEAALPG